MIIGDIVAGNARLFPHKVGIVDEHDRLTWKDVNQRVNRLANAILDLGLKKGDRVALICENCHQFAEFLFAVAKSGTIGICLNTRFTPTKLAYMINDCQPKLFLVQDKFLPIADQITNGIALKNDLLVIGQEGNFESLLSSYSTEEPEVEVDEQDTYLVQYTTGSTGTPKGTELTHRNWMNNCIVRLLLTHLAEDDIYQIAGALYAVGNLGHFLSACFAGVTVVLPVFSGQNFIEMIEKEKITCSYLNPTTYRIVRDYIETNKRQHNLASLRKLAIMGGQPSSFDQVKDILDYFNTPYSNSSKVYGMTEVCSPGTFLLPIDVAAGLRPDATEKERKRIDSVGKTMGNTEMRAVDENDNDVAPGQKGEILFKGDCVMKGYWNQPKLTQEALRHGWYHTGDIGIIDEDGYLYYVGRKDFLIKSGGFFIVPEEIEHTISQHPAVAEVAVIGVSDAKWGQMVKALVNLKSGMKATEEEIKEYCRKLLPRFQVPKSIDFVATLPRESTYGKISREDIIRIYS